ncbi:hypothetical protein [Shewanella surugensis]|uniref:Uncharacterized protein n=1 Tax=Shewanella surugensis TaxID=212020 RepID=A0ABT0L6V6_9GAMM|nr:hypothetical protein [Shewanella surugensis]MCL1123087.1 hypothetical protein [Shewanella surugensis]
MKVLLLSGMMLFSLLAKCIAQECQLPISLVGKSLLLRVYGLPSQSNPYADNIIEMFFKEKSYLSKVLKTGEIIGGEYKYHRYERDLAEISVEEVKEGVRAHYTETFVCQTDISGYYIFSTFQGRVKPEVRQNTGRYIFK